MLRFSAISVYLSFLACLCSGSFLEWPSVRIVRSTPTTYYIETLVVVDNKIYTRWLNEEPRTLSPHARALAAESKIKEYVSLLIRQANSRLGTLKDTYPDLNVQIAISHFILNARPLEFVPRIPPNNLVSSTAALDAFRNFVIDGNYGSKYDIILLLTGDNLSGEAGGHVVDFIKGRAFVGTVCDKDGRNVAVVQVDAGFQSEAYIAHEVGHVLGSEHDGQGTSSSCNSADRYLMSTGTEPETATTTVNPWHLSSCSANSIRNKIKELNHKGQNCLTNRPREAPEFLASADQLAGQMYTTTQQCQMTVGSNSRLCLGGPFGSIQNVCTSMYCQNNAGTAASRFKCQKFYAAEWTSCDNGKECRLGRCVTVPGAPNLPDTYCPAGDKVVQINGHFTCSEYVQLSPSACYKSDLRETCCASCLRIQKASVACPYGDRVTGCTKQACNHILEDGTDINKQCCQTCGYDAIETCTDVANIQGMSCQEYVTYNRMQNCYQASVAYKCCSTCRALRTNVTGCEYGDKTTGTFCPSVVKDVDGCSTYADQCCGSCRGLNQPDASSSPGIDSLLALAVVFNIFILLHSSLF